MKIAILSDFHIGYDRFREDAFRQAEEALELASQSADIIVIAGDIFDYRHPKPEVIAEAITLFKKFSTRKFNVEVSGFEGRGKTYTKVPIIAIPGTHERRTDGEVDSIDLLNLAGLLVNANQARVVLEKNGEKVVVYGVGGIAEERFKEILQKLNPKPTEGAFNLFMFHQSVHEFLPFSDDFVYLEELPEGFDLYIDGHIHSKVESKCHGKDFLIPGSTVLTQLKDGEQEEKGFFVYDTLKKNYSFHKINSRKFFMIRLNVDGMEPSAISGAVEKEIGSVKSKNKENPIIRIVLEGKLKEGFRSIDVGIKDVIEAHSKDAVIEVSKSGIEGMESKEAEELRSGILDNVSIRDYGMGIFMEKLKQNKYSLNVSPSILFDSLSSDAKKEIVIKEAMELVFSS